VLQLLPLFFFGVILSSIVSKPYHPGWHQIQVHESYDIVMKKREGAGNLIVFIGNQGEPTEIRSLESGLLELGFSVMTYNKTDAHLSSRGEVTRQLLEQTGMSSDFTKKILIIEGKMIPFEQEHFLPYLRYFAGIVILNPSDAMAQLSGFSHQQTLYNFLLLASGQKRDELERMKNLIFFRSTPVLTGTVANNNGPTLTADTELLQNDLFTNFLLLTRYQVRWYPAATVFKKGCATSYHTPSKIELDAVYVSGPATMQFCPLFLFDRNRAIYRARSVQESECIYRNEELDVNLICEF